MTVRDLEIKLDGYLSEFYEKNPDGKVTDFLNDNILEAVGRLTLQDFGNDVNFFIDRVEEIFLKRIQPPTQFEKETTSVFQKWSAEHGGALTLLSNEEGVKLLLDEEQIKAEVFLLCDSAVKEEQTWCCLFFLVARIEDTSKATRVTASIVHFTSVTNLMNMGAAVKRFAVVACPSFTVDAIQWTTRFDTRMYFLDAASLWQLQGWIKSVSLGDKLFKDFPQLFNGATFGLPNVHKNLYDLKRQGN